MVNFVTTFSIMNTTTRKKINREITDLNIIDQTDLDRNSKTAEWQYFQENKTLYQI